jgi:hypothetical protein
MHYALKLAILEWSAIKRMVLRSHAEGDLRLRCVLGKGTTGDSLERRTRDGPWYGA